jgi:hypothetical protein
VQWNCCRVHTDSVEKLSFHLYPDVAGLSILDTNALLSEGTRAAG